MSTEEVLSDDFRAPPWEKTWQPTDWKEAAEAFQANGSEVGWGGAVDGDCPHNYITAFQQPFEQHARGSDTPHRSFISRLGSGMCHDRYGPHGNSGPKFRAPPDGRALHLSAYKCVDLKQRVGHCKDKGSNAEGRDKLKTHLVSEKSCLRAVICRVSCELLAGTFMFLVFF